MKKINNQNHGSGGLNDRSDSMHQKKSVQVEKTNISQNHRFKGLKDDTDLKSVQSEQSSKSVIQTTVTTKPFYNSTITSDREVIEFGDFAEIVMGQSPDGNTFNQNGNGVALINGPTEFTEKYPVKVQWTTSPTKICKEGDILLCVRGSSTGRLNIANEEYCIGRGVAAVRAKKNSNNSFLEFQIENIVNKILSLTTGSTFPNIDSQSLKRIKVSLPPLPEQKAIAHILSLMDTAINKNNLLIAKKELQKKWLMQNLLTGKKRLNSVEKEKWKEYKISQLGQIITGTMPSMAKPEYYGDKCCWATVFGFEGVYINNTKIKLSEEGKKVSRIVPKGSILVTCIASIGKNAIANVSMSFNQQINAIVPNQSFHFGFIYYKVENSIHKLKKVAGAGAVLIINKSNFETIKLEFPSIEEQTAIAQVL